MKRKERTQILIHCPLDFLTLLKQKIESEHPVRIVEDPQLIDAAYNASLKCCEQLTAMIREQGQLQQKQRIQENKQILKTRVSFETMDKE